MNYQSPEAVAIGKADEVILGAKGSPLYDEVDQDFTEQTVSIIDVD